MNKKTRVKIPKKYSCVCTNITLNTSLSNNRNAIKFKIRLTFRTCSNNLCTQKIDMIAIFDCIYFKQNNSSLFVNS